MDERLVQWTLLKNLPELSNIIGKQIIKKMAEEYTTDQGRIDFILETPDEILIVELETKIDTAYKLSYCIEQVKGYRQISYTVAKPIKYAIIYEESTPVEFKRELSKFAGKLDIILKTSLISRIQELYNKVLEELKRTSGLYIGSPVAMDITHLRYLNKIIKSFYVASEDQLPIEDLRKIFKSQTNYGVYKRLSEDFEIVKYDVNSAKLTEHGVRFRDAFNAELIKTTATMPDLSNEQKRIFTQLGSRVLGFLELYLHLKREQIQIPLSI